MTEMGPCPDPPVLGNAQRWATIARRRTVSSEADVLRCVKRDVASEVVPYKLNGDDFCPLILQEA